MKIKLDQIEQNDNSRVIYKDQDLAELMSSMRIHGLLQPVGIRKLISGRYDAVFGNRRIMAAKKLDWDEIEAVVVSAETETDRDLLNLIENMKRTNTSLAEDGRMFLLLKNRGLTIPEIAARLDISVVRIQTALDVINEVPKEFHKYLANTNTRKRKGVISPSTTHQLLQISNGTHKLNKTQITELFNAARNGLSSNKAWKIAPLLKQGFSTKEALEYLSSMETIDLHFFIQKDEKERIEKRFKKGIKAFLTEEFLQTTSAKTLTRMVYRGRHLNLRRRGSRTVSEETETL